MPRDFPLEESKRIRSKCLDANTAGGAEVKSRMVATGVPFSGYSPTEGSADRGQLGGTKKKVTQVL